MKLAELQTELDNVDGQIVSLERDIRAQCALSDLLAQLGSETNALDSELEPIERELALWQGRRHGLMARIAHHPGFSDVRAGCRACNMTLLEAVVGPASNQRPA